MHTKKTISNGVNKSYIHVIGINRNTEETEGIDSNSQEMEVPLFDFYTISAATNNFSVANVIGEGGFGPVYKVINFYRKPHRSITF